MYTSDRNEIMHYADSMLHDAFLFLVAAIICAVFGHIYELFSHEVYSFYMIYAFLLPLVPGAFLNMVIVRSAVRKEKRTRIKEEDAAIFFPGKLTRYAWNSGIATLTVGCIFQGVLEIYGTTNKLIVVYPIAAAVLLGIAVFSFSMAYATIRKIRKKADTQAV